jgi:uncharacterized membrane protein YkgB
MGFEEYLKKITGPFGRFSLFVIYFWFGILKLIDVSPANPLVEDLLERTLPFMSFKTFNFGFAIYEMLIGILFLFPKATKAVLVLLFLHMITTFMPLVMLPAVTWQSPFVPTLEGQYIIKNLLIISVALFIAIQQNNKIKTT